jgi:pimeloyl-ACP methyl ester carboxylesterase
MNFSYPYPVQFLEFNSQGQTLRMAYLDVPASDVKPVAAAPAAPAAAAQPATTPDTPPAPTAAQPPAAGAQPAPAAQPAAAANEFGLTPAQVKADAEFDSAVERAGDPGAPAAGQAASAAVTENAAHASGTSNGRCVVLLHGKNFTAANWQSTIDLLTKQGYRVIAPDQIGFGKSSKPGTYQYSFAQLARNTRELLESLQLPRCSIVGHSMGGMLAARFALQYPAATERLILINPIGLEDYAAFVPYRTVDEWFADELKQTPESIREYQRTSYYSGSWKPEYEAQIQQLAGYTLHSDYARVAWVSALTYDMIFTQPVIQDFSRIRVPTRLIIGTRDRTALGRKFALPQTAASMGNYALLGKQARDLVPGAQLIELPGIGHVPQVEAFPQYRNALLKFLR